MFRFGITPLFLFSGTFFPVEQLPTALQAVAWLTPSYHGVALTRDLALGTVGDDPLIELVHLLVLIGFTVVGTQTFQLGSDTQRDFVMAKGL